MTRIENQILQKVNLNLIIARFDFKFRNNFFLFYLLSENS